MKVTTLLHAPKVPSGLDAHKMYTSSTLDIINLHLAPGEKVPLHVNPLDVVFCVIQGSVSMEVNGKIMQLNTFDVVEVLAGVERGLTNNSKEDFRVLILKKIV